MELRRGALGRHSSIDYKGKVGPGRGFLVKPWDLMARSAQLVLHSDTAIRRRFADVDPLVLDIFSKVRRYTMTSPERVIALCEAVRYVVRSRVPGAVVECGVWRGGSSMAAALMFDRLGDQDRQFYLFDTFEGMSAPSKFDRRARDGADAFTLLKEAKRDEKIWCVSPLEEVRDNLERVGCPMERVTLVQGRVEETVPARAPDEIAILRLDTDWYDSTRHELEQLFPRLAPGGVLIIDDYGAWAGARRAVDEFIEGRQGNILLNRIDETGRIAVKLA
jgi:O-methyltransferase